MSFLIGEKLQGGYGGADILKGCTISVEKGEIAVIVGPNGAGKSTAMKALLGMLKLNSGSIRLDGEDITGLTPQARVAKGMAFVPQTGNVFTGMSVERKILKWEPICERATLMKRWSRCLNCSQFLKINARN